MGCKFLVSHRKLCTPKHFHKLSLLEICRTTNTGSFTQAGIYPCLLLPDTSFLYHFHEIVQLCWTLSNGTKSTQSITKHSVDFRPCTHTHSMRCPRAYAMHHCLLYHATCLMNVTWKTQSTPLTGCHGQITSPTYDFHTSFHLCQYIMHIYQHTTCHSMFKQ